MANRLAEYENRQAPLGSQWGKSQSQDLQTRFNSLMKQATHWIVEHPEIALGAAIVTGVVLGWLIKRR